MFNSDYLMTFNATITSVANNLKKIHIAAIISNEFASTYYENHLPWDEFNTHIFRQRVLQVSWRRNIKTRVSNWWI